MSDTYNNLIDAVTSSAQVKGYTHNFYRYPARFSPQFVREVISRFSLPGDTVLDPFMGGGTSIIESLSLNRFAIGIDLNPLAHFITTVKTTPLSNNDRNKIWEWLYTFHFTRPNFNDCYVKYLPPRLERLLDYHLSRIEYLPFPRQQRFVRCALLKTSQWALDCRYNIPTNQQIIKKLRDDVLDMFAGLDELTDACHKTGVAKNRITRRRSLFCRSVVGLESEDFFSSLRQKPRLVVTSPPYPGVHVLYHRWQIRGRRETSAPYWIAALNDGHGEAHYTFGGRSKSGVENYFITLEEAFRSIKKVIDPNAVIVQLVAFSDVNSQFIRYLNAMREAGYKEIRLFAREGQTHVWREVPNRKWYSRIKRGHDSTKEVLLLHRPE